MGAQLSKGGHGRGYRKNQFSDINVTPMVDVMLVLLIIFMVTAPMLTTGVTVDLPESSSSPVSGDDEPLSVSVKKDGSLFIQETPVSVEDLGVKLDAIAGQKKETRIFVRGDKDIDYGTMMKVVAAINSAGFLKVALLTDSSGATKH
jgi:biopolymer transport protein TolR